MKKTYLNASRIAAMAAFAVFATGCGGDGLVEEFAKLGTDADRVKFLREKLKYTVPVNGNNEPITVDTLKELKAELEKAGATAADKEKAIKAKLGIVVKIGAGSGKTDAQIFQEALNAKFPKATYPDFYKGTSEDADVAEITTKLAAGATATTNLATAQPKADNFDVWNTGITAVATVGATASTNFATEWAGLKAATTAANTNVALAAFDTKINTEISAKKKAAFINTVGQEVATNCAVIKVALADVSADNTHTAVIVQGQTVASSVVQKKAAMDVYRDFLGALYKGEVVMIESNTLLATGATTEKALLAAAVKNAGFANDTLPLGSFVLHKNSTSSLVALFKALKPIKSSDGTSFEVTSTNLSGSLGLLVNVGTVTASVDL